MQTKVFNEEPASIDSLCAVIRSHICNSHSDKAFDVFDDLKRRRWGLLVSVTFSTQSWKHQGHSRLHPNAVGIKDSLNTTVRLLKGICADALSSEQAKTEVWHNGVPGHLLSSERFTRFATLVLSPHRHPSPHFFAISSPRFALTISVLKLLPYLILLTSKSSFVISSRIASSFSMSQFA